MSGHNPHGRHGQPVNSSQWNHLQVPSYIPRQPQLAHMSNERSIRSPLAWHHTANNSAEALYGYMAAAAAAAAAAASSSNHKTTPLDINPLLPFVRSASNPMPFGSVDLSISSGTRNSMTPSPRSQISPAASNVTPSTSANAAHENNMPSQDSLALFAEMSEQLAALKANSALASNLFARDPQPPPANFSMNSERPPSNHETPMELIKETNCNENDSFSAAALPLHQLFSANSPNVPQNLNELSKSLLTLINNASSSNAPHSVPPAHHQSTNSDLPKSSASTSNDESVDSQTCNGDGDGNTKRTRCRRRKPQKTIRMANDAPLAPLANGTCADSSSRSHKISEKSLEDTSQTHSMDLSNYSAGHQAFSNGKLTNSIFSGTTAKPMNGFATMNMTHYPDPLSSMPSASNHLKATFNTDDLVKKVEEIVKCNSNEAPPPPTNFAPIRNGDENKGFIEQLSNGDDKNGSISQPVSDDRASPERLNGNENGIDLMTSHETDAKTSKANMDEVPLMPTAEVKLPDISLPMANSTPKHNHVDEVENHLDKMFSHIENVAASTTTATATNGNSVAEDTTQNDSENQNSQTNNETNNDSELAAKSNDEQGTSSAAATATATASTSQSKPSRSRKRPAANGKKRGSSSARRPNKTNSKASSNGKNAAKNSNASKNNKNVKSNRSTEKVDSKKPKDELTAAEPVTKFRGPYIQIQPDGSENIVNAPLTEEIIEKQNRIRKTVIAGGSSARSKVSGLHVSTLSNKYDAVTTDASWMCVFCKLGPHKYGLGDLFGPFILSVDSKEFQESQFDPSEDVFRSHRTSADMVLVKGGMKVVPAKASTSSAATANNAGNSSCRKKRKLTEPSTSTQPPIFVPNIFHGMTKVSETAYEVWVHEDCVVWADGVYLVGARIVGLDAAVWSCSRHKCSICEQYGAVVTCLKRECKIEAHVPCAMRAQWSLNEATFQTHCKLHAITDSGSADTADDGSRHQTKEI